MTTHVRRLIEVDLPIQRISAHARREKSIRHGHISTLHIWWARRPLAACRSITCAALLPDPADPNCPESFRQVARAHLREWSSKYLSLLSPASIPRFVALQKSPEKLNDHLELRQALLDFIADFANWDNSSKSEYLTTIRSLVQAAHEALGGAPGTKPLVVDPFSGGGAIPLEALRVGADAFASDLNPVAVLLNKVVLEYIPRHGTALARAVRAWGAWVREQAAQELATFYPKDPDAAFPIAYLWARTITCEGPGCGTEVPLLRSLWLARKDRRSVALRLIPRQEEPRIDIQVVPDAKSRDVGDGTVRRGSVTCPRCSFTMPVTTVRRQLRERRGGTAGARLLAVVTTRPGQQGRFYRVPEQRDLDAVSKARLELRKRVEGHMGDLSLVPDESTQHYHSFVNRGPIYGMLTWGDYFTDRQALALSTFVSCVRRAREAIQAETGDVALATAVETSLALAVDRQVDAMSSLCRWHVTGEKHTATFGRQALPMVWDFSEVNPLSEATGGFAGAIEWVAQVCAEGARADLTPGHVEQASATTHPLPDDVAQAFITDPPYYYSVQYADLSDYFYVWLRRILAGQHGHLLAERLTPKDEEIIVQSPGHEFALEGKNGAFYESRMKLALQEGRRILSSSGIGVVVFAHTSTSGWEALLQALIEAGWTVTGSWPIDTEMASRVIAQDRAVLASSIHLVCRPREVSGDAAIGDWRDVLTELPRRIHEWMPRLTEEGVVGADAIFACLGPALEVFSRYAHVEKTSGEIVTLKEYLEQVWGAVAREALALLFRDADTSGLEADARLTAMWLWTLGASTPPPVNGSAGLESGEADSTDEGETVSAKAPVAGYTLEYDAARKIAQGLGAHMDKLRHVVEVRGETARLLPISERTRYLFGGDSAEVPPSKKMKKPKLQIDMFSELAQAEEEATWGITGAPAPGTTVLDRVHQAMILFAAGRSDALQRFLVEQGVGANQAFWRLAQALSALYPSGTEEKRWVDGVLARKKGLGF